MTYNIPEVNFDKFMTRVKTLQNKANKMGLPFEFKDAGTFEEIQTTSEGEAVSTTFHIVDFDFNIKREGWTVLGCIKAGTEDQNMVYPIGNFESAIPSRFYSGGIGKCEHCGAYRNNKILWIVRNDETEDVKAVGSSCIKEYTGVLNSTMLGVYETFEAAADKYMHQYPQGWNATPVYDTTKFVSFAAYYTAKNGYVRSGEHHSTRDDAWDQSCKSPRHPDDAAIASVQAGDYAEFVASALEYAKSLINSDNEFEHNIGVVASKEWISSQFLGFAAYIPTLYKKYLDKLDKTAAHILEESSEYVGAVGDKIEKSLKAIELITMYQNNYYYGTSYMYKLTDTDGNIYVWTTSKGAFELLGDPNHPHTIRAFKGTVKSHSEYKGVKQTIVTRCKLSA